MQFFSKK